MRDNAVRWTNLDDRGVSFVNVERLEYVVGLGVSGNVPASYSVVVMKRGTLYEPVSDGGVLRSTENVTRLARIRIPRHSITKSYPSVLHTTRYAERTPLSLDREG